MFELTEEWNDNLVLDPEPPKKETKVFTFSKKRQSSQKAKVWVRADLLLPFLNKSFLKLPREWYRPNTKNNCWAEQMLNAWVDNWNKLNPGSVPTDMLSCHV